MDSGSLRLGPEGIDATMDRLLFFEDPGYNPFEGMLLEELGKERHKWTICRQFFESELRSQPSPDLDAVTISHSGARQHFRSNM
jgi:hypothetical protein